MVFRTFEEYVDYRDSGVAFRARKEEGFYSGYTVWVCQLWVAYSDSCKLVCCLYGKCWKSFLKVYPFPKLIWGGN